jgi:hypothetical protein
MRPNIPAKRSSTAEADIQGLEQSVGSGRDAPDRVNARLPDPARYGPEATGNPTSRDYNKASILDVLLSRAP